MKRVDDMAEFRDKRVVITGGAGMLGSAIARIALDSGAEVTVIDAFLPLYGGNYANLPQGLERLNVVAGDIRDAPLMDRLIEPADYVFNLAAQVSYLDADRDPFTDLDVNCRGHLCVLEACRKSRRLPKVVFASSRFVYGTVEYNPVDEAHKLNCVNIYGIHKLAGEKYHRFYFESHGLPTVSLRISNPYGPRQQMKHGRYGIVNWFIRQALDGNPLTIFGDGEQIRDYIYVEDLAQAVVAVALTATTAGETYNVGSGAGTRFRDVVDLVAREIPGTKVVNVPWPPERARVETGDYVADVRKLTGATGWRPSVSLKEGVQGTIAFYREHWRSYW